MRDLTLTETEAVTGAIGPPGAIAGGTVAGVAYIGAQAGAGTTPTVLGASGAVLTGAVAGFFSPISTAQAAGASLAGFYAGFAGGLVGRGA